MSFDRKALIAACDAHGIVARVVVAHVRGSAPREVGAAMLVWQDGASGTIGGGTLEHQAMLAAREMSLAGVHKVTRHALGPDLGQCCGGSVDLLTESYDLSRARGLPEDMIARGEGDMPLAVARLRTQARNSGVRPVPQLVKGWMVEPVSTPQRHLWVWGAGHVGRALVDVLRPLPGMQITWADTSVARFPDQTPEDVEVLTAAHPEGLVPYAPDTAEHLIVTYSHDLDLALCHRLLLHGFAFAGLIGSATKWARFRSRLKSLGHTDTSIAQITCPIGNPTLGKHPQAIALGVGADLLLPRRQSDHLKGTA